MTSKESSKDELDNTNSRPIVSFSMSHALSFVRQRQEERERAKQEEEQAANEAAKEKAREKRKRRRENQKLARARAKERLEADGAICNATEELNDDAIKKETQHDGTNSHSITIQSGDLPASTPEFTNTCDHDRGSKRPRNCMDDDEDHGASSDRESQPPPVAELKVKKKRKRKKRKVVQQNVTSESEAQEKSESIFNKSSLTTSPSLMQPNGTNANIAPATQDPTRTRALFIPRALMLKKTHRVEE